MLGATVALTIALALAACSGLPMTSPVMPGRAPGSAQEVPDFVLRPDSPQRGATPQEIVEGFIRAGSGPAGGWAVAREYLTPEASWNPLGGVTIDEGERAYTDAGLGGVTLALTQIAGVDASGAYSVADLGSALLDFRLEQRDGEWRISQAPDGVVLNQNVFANVYKRYQLMFFDDSWSTLVPDLRWFPTTNAAARVTDALVDGPSPWLAASVRTAIPDNVTPPGSVPAVSGVAQVELGPDVVSLDQDTLDRMQTQFETSLALAGVTEVQMTVGGTPLEAERLQKTATGVDARALALTDAGFGFLTSGALEPIAGLSDAITGLSSTPLAIQVSPTQDAAAVRLDDGTVVRVPADGPVSDIDRRPGMIDPTIDRYGWIWTVPRDSPTSILATSPDGEQVSITNGWGGATAVTAMVASRDGTRIAALVESGGRTFVWVKGIIRQSDGTPAALGVELELASPAGQGTGLTWLDDATVGALVLGADGPATLEQPVGGPGSTVAAPIGVSSISGSNQTTTVRLRGDDGALYVRRGTNWNQTASGVLVLATQQGAGR
ncbi:GerMN domain-containing protein [Microbacterium sp. 1P10UB]|uniref:LpqB family beta-propeller domain-containing protein n=1 Tax=unclassified Microbacterium TaxID=2609290 RepID=UPI0039A1D026